MNLSDAEIKASALNLWANHIETGSVSLSGNDLIERGEKVVALTNDQKKLVCRLRALAKSEANNSRHDACNIDESRNIGDYAAPDELRSASPWKLASSKPPSRPDLDEMMKALLIDDIPLANHYELTIERTEDGIFTLFVTAGMKKCKTCIVYEHRSSFLNDHDDLLAFLSQRR